MGGVLMNTTLLISSFNSKLNKKLNITKLIQGTIITYYYYNMQATRIKVIKI